MGRKMDIDRSMHNFQFTRNMFRHRNLPTFREYIHPRWAGKPIFYLEIGVFEGQSLTWMLQHVLTHEDSRAVGVDPWLEMSDLSGELMEEVMSRARHNLKPWADKCELVRATSVSLLRTVGKRRQCHGVKQNGVDVCMIDGGHHALNVLADATLCLPAMKKGGWILFDDVENTKRKTDHVKEGIAMFLEKYGKVVKHLWKHQHMEAYEKL